MQKPIHYSLSLRLELNLWILKRTENGEKFSEIFNQE